MTESDAIAAKMVLAFVAYEDQRKLVGAWPRLTRHDGSRSTMREWFAAAGVDDRYQIKVWARSLLRLGICRPDGTVEPEVARAVAAAAVMQLAGRARRRS